MTHKPVFYGRGRRWSVLALASVTTVIFAASLASGPAFAAHIPGVLDVPGLWAGLPGSGYLNFVEPGPVPALAPSGTEEYTGWVDNPAGPFGLTGATLDATGVGPAGPAVDNGLTHGDRADFDMVVENRPIEVGAIAPPVGLGPLHGALGFLTWEIAPTAASAHIDPATGAAHAVHGAALTLALPDYAAGPSFLGVDVFSVIANPTAPGVPPPAVPPPVVTDPFGLVSDAEPGARAAALDYFLDFCDITSGLCHPGVPVVVFVPGWTFGALADDYVARWVPAPGAPAGFAPTHALIDPVGPPEGHDEIVQIDAVVAFIPEPATIVLGALGLLGASGFVRRRPRD